MASSSSTSSSAAPKICFNSHCKEPKSEGPRRKAWRLRSGEFADLCDRCSCAYEKGSFCETFHSDSAGWRNCETCGKRVHCGCIVSASAYVLLDAGGIECFACARKSVVMTPNQMWPSPLVMPPQLSKRKDFPIKSWKQMTGPFPGQWRQSPHIWNTSSIQSDLHQRLSYEFDRPNNTERMISGGRSSITAQEKKFEDLPEKIGSSSLNHVARDRFANGNSGPDPVSAFSTYQREEGNADGLQDPGHLVRDNDPMSTRKGGILDPCSTSSVDSLPSSTLKEDPSSLLIGLAAPFPPPNGAKDLSRVSTTQPQRQMAPQSSKQFYPHNGIDGELQAQMRNGRPRVDARARTQLLPRYWPRITDQELQQISGDSNSVITPLFEKMLSASDAGRIGRLVLPKKCAEAYFPTISQPEGLPLKVQDASGKEWVFQFRFWPNNNSRMYVLEGVTPCIQSMQLQAGDTVTFSRIDPEGRLVMGFRKASNASAEQDTQSGKAGNGFSTSTEGNSKNSAGDSNANLLLRPLKGSAESRNSINTADQGTWSKFDKSGFIQKDGPAARSLQGPSKRKGSTLGSKSKRLRIENEDSMELKITWEEAQELLRPPPNHVPTTIVIEGHEIEEYEEAPVLGKRTYFTTNQAGDNYQWAQCEDCSKWRKLPVDALLPFRWTCSDNKWDPDRSSCSSAQELSLDQLADLIPIKTGAPKRSKVKVEADNIEVSDGLDTLANLAILGEGEAIPTSSQPTTKHPRHRPGCTCIVCIQPPSGKGPKHKQTCTCNVCLTVKRRFRTLMLRREKRQSEREAETARKQQQHIQSPDTLPTLGNDPSSAGPSIKSSPQKVVVSDDGVVEEGSEHTKTSPSPLKAQIDLNIQPEREEEPSPKSDAGGMMRLLRDAAS
ncbi:B3 domain-containing protein Os07g0563300-like [Phoenix dactylifera]|uniref:B3 domain-containing protein Os07g0563300-like n=1 Tax=Phoenix dactylifera TaxID=42345 RepID=A0A8B9AWC9_PHODC|nr:B3 domain-containing protein Os07g0563300-like [Phoenix dactylifera]